jgi:ABC-type transport system involved in multi-copper enzyme maturation permease subunit
MSTPALTPYRSAVPPGHYGFGQLLRAEWAKFRTVRGWVIGIVVAMLVTLLIGILTGLNSHNTCGNAACHPVIPTGPGGEAVTDSYYFVYRSLTGNGSITVRVTSLTGQVEQGGGLQGGPSQPGLQPWSKAGLIVADSTRQGAAYAAIMVTGGHGVRMQYNYTQDTAGRPGGVSAVSPRWLRLTRNGDTVTGYDSTDGSTWTKVGTAHLAGLASTAQAGLFATSPQHSPPANQQLAGGTGNDDPTTATATFDRVATLGGWSGGAWSHAFVGGNSSTYPIAGQAGAQQSGGGFTVTGSGDIAPAVSGATSDGGQSIERVLIGAFAGLIAVVVVGSLFITAEYRRGLIRVSLAASPRRGRILAAKAIVLGSVTFVAGLIGAGIAVWLGERFLRGNGYAVYPVAMGTEIRVIAGTAGLLAVAAVLALAVGAMLRHSAGAVTVAIAAIILPYILATTAALPAGPAQWLLRITPAAGFAIQQATPQYYQVTSVYTPTWGYFPLAPWAGFAVLCGYAVLALGLATYLLRRRDA